MKLAAMLWVGVCGEVGVGGSGGGHGKLPSGQCSCHVGIFHCN